MATLALAAAMAGKWMASLFTPVEQCPRCGSHYVDPSDASYHEQVFVVPLGLRTYSCHRCLLRIYSWRRLASQRCFE